MSDCFLALFFCDAKPPALGYLNKAFCRCLIILIPCSESFRDFHSQTDKFKSLGLAFSSGGGQRPALPVRSPSE